MELLVGRLVVLQGVHLGEVVATGDLAEQGDQMLRRVLAVGVLLGEGRGLLHLVGRSPSRQIGCGQPLADGQAADELFDLSEELVLGVER